MSWADGSGSAETEGTVNYRESGAWLWNNAPPPRPSVRYAYTPVDSHGRPDHRHSYVSPRLYHGAITELDCSSTYDFRVASSDDKFSRHSATFTFRTLPCVSPTQGIATALIGDLGQTDNASQTVDHVLTGMVNVSGIDQTWVVGDLSYADSSHGSGVCTHESGCDQTRWDSWGKLVEKIAAIRPFQVLPGNHEVEADPMPALGEPFEAYINRFVAPDSPGGAFWYSWEGGNTHFVSLSSYRNFSVGSDQYEWLLSDLKKVDRERTPWLFVATHAPWYNSNTHHQNEPEEVEMKAALEEVFDKYAVDVLFCGHVHAYERSHPVYNGTVTPGKMTEINIGDGGNREVLEPDDWMMPQPAWSAFRSNGFGHGKIETYNESHARWTWHRIVDEEKDAADDVWLIKNTHLHKAPSDPKTGVTAVPV